MSSVAAVVLLGFGADFATDHLPINLDGPPPGAAARLGSARFDGEVHLSPDGRLLAVNAVLDRKSFINLHDAETGKLLRTLRPPLGLDKSINYVRFASPTRLLGMDGPSNAGFVCAWDATTGRCEIVVNSSQLDGLYYIDHVSDDAAVLIDTVTTEKQELELHVYQTKPLKKVHTIRPLHRLGLWFQLSRDGSTLLCGGYNPGAANTDSKLVQVFDTKTGKERRRIEVGNGYESSRFGLSLDGARLVAQVDGTTRLYDTTSGKSLFTLKTDGDKEATVSFDYSGMRVLLAHGTAVTVFSATNGKTIKEYAVPTTIPGGRWPAALRQVAFTADGKARALCRNGIGEGGVEVWDLETGKPLGECPGHGEWIKSLRFTADGRQLISHDEEEWEEAPAGRVLTWDLATRKSLTRRPVAGKSPDGWLSPDGKYRLDFRYDPFEFFAVNTETGGEVYRIEFRGNSYRGKLRQVQFSPNGKTFFLEDRFFPYHAKTPADSGTYSVYNVETGKPKCVVQLEQARGVGGSFSPDGSRVVFAVGHPGAKKDGLELLAIDTKTWKPVSRELLPELPKQLWVLPDNRTAGVVSLRPYASHVRLRNWDTQTGKVVRDRELDGRHHDSVISADRKLLAIVTFHDDEAVRIHVIDTESLADRAVFTWSPAPTHYAGLWIERTTALAISPDNRTLAVGARDGTIVLYDIPPRAKTPSPR